jgi:tRNA(Ile)-lysidine synthase TilS/MesJ
MFNKKAKCLLLLSGGLDSILAAKLLLEQNIEIEAVNFRTNFCGPSKARPAAKQLGVNLREENIREEFLEILKKPKFGYGSGLNPCIDCHALMLKKAGEIMRAEGFDFVATGEVLGERPMSQHRQALDIVEKESNLKSRLLRPLSAKLLEPTLAEKEGLVDRERLLDISGRSRSRQMALAEKFGIKEYPTPSGGCALTEKGFARRTQELMKFKPDFSSNDLDLIRIGRHFFENEGQIILGRSKGENDALQTQAQNGDLIVKPENFAGPVALIRGGGELFLSRAKDLILEFSKENKAAHPQFKIEKI